MAIKETSARIIVESKMNESEPDQIEQPEIAVEPEEIPEEVTKPKVAWWARTDRKYSGTKLLRQRAQLNLLKQEKDRAENKILV
jgi:hypothetical protein